jgi:uncharacterized protein (DUF362 family)
MKRRSRLTRRGFIKLVAAGSTAVALEPFLAACGEAPDAVPPAGSPQPAAFQTQTASIQPSPESVQNPPAAESPAASAPGETPVQPAPVIEPTQIAAEPVDLAVLRADLAQEKQNSLSMVQQLLAPLGGIERFVSAGQTVVIKPNICTAYYGYEYAATTNPYIISALVALCLGAGARTVKVMDSPFGGSAKNAYVTSGIQEQVENAGGEMVLMSSLKFMDTDIPQGVDIKRWAIFDEVLNADVLINVPILKHHSLARLTIGMKNLMGVINNRSAIHRNMGQRLADLASLVKPDLTIVDAMRMLMANGPTGGSLNDVNPAGTLIASADIIAADSYAAQLFGIQPDTLEYIQAGAAMGLGRSDLGSLKVEEINF